MSVFRWTSEQHEQYKAKRAKECAAVDLPAPTKPAPPMPKYGNVRTNGYASKRESKRAFQLKLMQEAGEIHDLREQVKYVLIPRQLNADGSVAERACTYTADFVYKLAMSGKTVVEDAKGFSDQKWPIKRKLMLMVHGVKVQEV